MNVRIEDGWEMNGKRMEGGQKMDERWMEEWEKDGKDTDADEFETDGDVVLHVSSKVGAPVKCQWCMPRECQWCMSRECQWCMSRECQ